MVRFAYPLLIPLLLLSGGLGLHALRASRFAAAARAMSLLATGATLSVWVARWIEVEHFPLFGTYENALSTALAVLAAAIGWEIRHRALAVSPASALIAALVLVQGVRYDAMPYGLTISERSLVVDVHAVLAWSAFGVFAVSAALALRVALSPSAFDTHLLRLLTLGFVLHTAMIASGSLYKFLLFGRLWSWDPIETMALIAWLAYGTLLHMSLLAGWGAQRVARWGIFTFVILVVSYRAIIYFPPFATYHIFDIGLKLHL